MSEMPSPLVSTDWLAETLEAPDLSVVDASWHMPATGRDAAAEFAAAHIPGAVFYDIDAIADTSVDLPHMAAAAEHFAEMVGALGISDTDRIVVYDTVGLFSVARAWWNLRAMGARSVSVLAGGLPKWRAESRPIETGETSPASRAFAPHPHPGAIVAASDIVERLDAPDRPQIVDVRAAPRFNAEVDEPRPGLRRGRIPGSFNLPFTELVADGTLRDSESLERAFIEAGIDPARPVVSSCGSGVTAPILNLALAAIGHDQLAVYDGSWAEWGADARLPLG